MASYDDWLCTPPEPEPYKATCVYCGKMTLCPCGCGWGWCDDEPGEIFEADRKIGCEEGFFASAADEMAWECRCLGV